MSEKLPAPTKETDGIQVENFNGLNLVASSLNIPYEESPDMRNCAVDPGGAITKRGGTELANTVSVVTASVAVTDIDYQSPDGFNWILRKLGQELYIYQLVNEALVLYANGGTNPVKIAGNPVWSAAAANVRVVPAATSEVSTPRMFIVSGVDSTKVVNYTVATSIFTVAAFAPTGAPANWTGTNHPRCVGIWDGRLYLAGTPNAPSRLWASKAGNFDDFTAGVTANDGFAFDVYAQREQRLVAIYPYRSSLLLFARRGFATLTSASFVSGSGSSAGVVTPTNLKVTVISTLGVVNAQCVTPVENTIHYLSDTGVYELVESTDPSAPYQAGELTIKVTPLFKDIPTVPLDLSSACYDTARREYWICIPDKGSMVANRIYTYKVQRKAWAPYDLGVYSKKTVVRYIQKVFDTAGRSRIVMVIEGGSNAFHTLAWNADRVGSYIDFRQTFVGNGSTLSFTHSVVNILKPLFTYTVSGFATNLIQTDFIFDSLAATSDLQIKVNGVVITAWLKVGEDKIQFLSTLAVGTVVDFSYVPTVSVSVTVDNIEQDPSMVSILGDVVTLTSAPVNNAVVKIGILYRAYYDTYEFNFGSIRNLKRLNYLYVYAKALEDQEVFLASDVNAAANQDPSSLVFFPKTLGQLDIRYWKDGKTINTTNVTDVYYNPAGVWDTALWDAVYPAGYSSNLLKVGLQGVCKYLQIRFYSRSSGSFSLPGFMISIHHKGQR